MEILFEQEYLRELFYEGKTHDKKHRFQPQVIRKYGRVIELMESLESTEDLYRFKALHYERLIGDKKDRESVKVNNQYRIEFRSAIIEGERKITICNILELSNHYK
ncbi:type II toxin-antitoxin system RelE/ParE family toxin [Prevotella corporis]|uniref:type II toxin-antitoxin system RelE/ParE family toxin n=1 Tax=Prevotella corporis TaxID=28128 RepID=UPI002365EA2C|nr:type II toxin-antitoxin system RelE/ParE family toxin [Prevotella corporis]